MSDVDVEAVIAALRESGADRSQNAGLKYGTGRFGLEQAEKLSEPAVEAAEEHREEIRAIAAEQLQELNDDVVGSVEATRDELGARESEHLDLADAESFLTAAIRARAHSARVVVEANEPTMGVQEQSDAAFMAAYHRGAAEEDSAAYDEVLGPPDPAEHAALLRELADPDLAAYDEAQEDGSDEWDA